MSPAAMSSSPRLRAGVIRRGNTWSYVIRVTDARGVSKPRWVGGFASEDEAKAARDRARLDARRGEYVGRDDITVAAYLRQWLDGHALVVKPKTLAGYRNLINSYVVPRLGRLKLQAVRPSTLSAFYQELLTSGGKGGRPLSARTVQYVHSILRKAFADAVLVDRILPSNPAATAKRPRKTLAVKGSGVWDAEQLAAFLGAARRHRLFAFFHVAAYTGARRGELLHLRWSDVDLGPSSSVRIRGTVNVVDGTRVEGTTKGGRERIVSIDPGTVTVLVEHRARQEQDRLRAEDSWEGTGYVFCREIGAPLYPDTVSQLMPKLVAEHNASVPAARRVPSIRLHDLRHTHATLLLKAGVPAHVVAARLGHADASITLRVYAHVLGDQATGAASIFADLMAERTASTAPDAAVLRADHVGTPEGLAGHRAAPRPGHRVSKGVSKRAWNAKGRNR